MRTATHVTKTVTWRLLVLMPMVAACPYLQRMLRATPTTKEAGPIQEHEKHVTRQRRMTDDYHEGQVCGGSDFCYGNLVPSLPPLVLNWSTLVAIAEPAALAEEFGYMEDSQARRNVLGGFLLNNDAGNGAAGYTYLGQFLSHDINRDETSTLGQFIDPSTLPNTNTPSVDLDTLYSFDGCIPELNNSSTFKVNGRDFERNVSTENANICDSRNDEHRIVSQLTVAWMTLHNKFVDELGLSFDEAKSATILEWQAVVLTDLLPNLLDEEVLAAVKGGDRVLYSGDIKDSQAMPVEFSTAAFRLFHSRARGRYRINDGFDGSSSDKPRARLFDIGLDEPILLGGSTLPAEMIVDWDRFFGDPNAVDSKVELSRIMDMLYSRPIIRLPFNEAGTFEGTQIVVECPENEIVEVCPIPVTVPEVCPEGSREGEPCELKANLALLDLLRGQTHSLPGGIAFAEHVKTQLLIPTLDVLDFASMAGTVFGLPGDLPTVDEGGGEVPLLLYLVHESIRDHDGQRLGNLGSRIIAEVMYGLVETSEPSIFGDDSDDDEEEDEDVFVSLVTGGSTVTMLGVLDYIGWH